jgi:hypothetical protein
MYETIDMYSNYYVIFTLQGNLVSEKYLRLLQSVLGDPTYPSGQVQTGLWFTTLQLALGAQRSCEAQGFKHFLFWHAA